MTTSPSNNSAININNPGAKIVRFIINYLRQAEDDYLSPCADVALRRSAWDILFGLKSPLSKTCLLLGIDPVAAKLRLLQAFLRGEKGDPIFGYLLDPDALYKIQYGRDLDIPSLEKLKNDNVN